MPLPLVNCYFNHQSYYFSDSHDIFVFFNASDDHRYYKYLSNYEKSYMVLTHMMAELINYNIKNANIHASNRLIEELKGDISPLNSVGINMLRNINRKLFPYFVDCYFIKTSEEDVEDYLRKGEQSIDKRRSTESINNAGKQ